MVKEWIDVIRKIVREEIKVMQKYQDNNMNSMKYWSGTVASVDTIDNTATILLPNETVPTAKKKNKTGQALFVGDEVILFSMSGALGDAFVQVVKKQYDDISSGHWTVKENMETHTLDFKHIT